MGTQDILNTILPPLRPHVTNNRNGTRNDYYNPRDRNGDGDKTDTLDIHGALDINYEGGQDNGINKKFPEVHSPVSGQIINNPSASSYRTITIRDKFGNLHRLLHSDKVFVRKNSWVTKGQKIALMGGRGPKGRFQYDRHVHYQIHDKHGSKIDPEEFYGYDTPQKKTSPVIPDRSCNYRRKPHPDTIYGGPSFDEFTILSGNNKISSGGGADIITTGPGRDVLEGGPGADYLAGGPGNDIYIYNPGDGKDQITEANQHGRASNPGNDTIQFGGCITPKDITTQLVGNHLVIKFRNNPNDSITVADWKHHHKKQYDNGTLWKPFKRRIENFEFSNGQKLNAKQFTKNMTVIRSDSGMPLSPGMVSDLTGDTVQITDSFPGEGAVFSNEDNYLSTERMNCLIQDVAAFASDDGVLSSNIHDAAANVCPVNIAAPDIASDWRQSA